MAPAPAPAPHPAQRCLCVDLGLWPVETGRAFVGISPPAPATTAHSAGAWCRNTNCCHQPSAEMYLKITTHLHSTHLLKSWASSCWKGLLSNSYPRFYCGSVEWHYCCIIISSKKLLNFPQWCWVQVQCWCCCCCCGYLVIVALCSGEPVCCLGSISPLDWRLVTFPWPQQCPAPGTNT